MADRFRYDPATGRYVREDASQQQDVPTFRYDPASRSYVSGSQPASASRAPQRQRYNALQSFGSGAADAASFGFGDELMGVGAGVGEALTGGDYNEGYRRGVNASRVRQMQAQDDNELAFLGGQIGGALVGGGGAGLAARGAFAGTRLGARAANLARNAGFGTRVGTALLGGAAGGALYGAGSGVHDRAGGALQGAALGAAFGAGGQVLGEGIGRVAGGVMRSTSPQARAADYVARSMQRTGLDEQGLQAQLQRHAQMGHGAMMMDAYGDAGTDLVMGAAARPSLERNAMRQALDDRNNAAGQQATDDIWQTLTGGGRQDAGEVISDLTANSRAQAAPLYAQVDQQRLPSVPQGLRELMRRNPSLFGPADAAARRQVLSETGVADNVESLPLYWRRLNEAIGSTVRANRVAASRGDLQAAAGSEISTLTSAARSFNDEISNLLGPTYQRAQSIYRNDRAATEALEDGVAAIGGQMNDIQLAEMRTALQRMSQSEREAFRVGAISRISNMLERADTGTGRADVLRGLLGNRAQRRLLHEVFGGEQGFDDLIKRLDHQREMAQNAAQTGIRVNSVTAPMMAAQRAQAASTGGLRERLLNMFTSDAADAQQEAVSDEILRLMRTPAADAWQGVQQAGGVQQWARQQGLLGRALARQREMQDYRLRAMRGAALGSPFGSIGLTSAADYGGV